MNRIDRLAAILLLLQDRPRTSDELAARFEVSRRTILRDVQALSEMGVPVIAREGPGGGYWLPEDYHPEPLPLTAPEVFLLLFSMNAIERLSDLPFRAERATLIAKLRALLPRSALPGVEGMLSAAGLEVPEREQRAPFLDDLLQAAAEGRWLKLTYQSSQRISTLHLLPRRITSENGFWYLLAYTHEHHENRVFRVDRVKALAEPGDDFHPSPPVDPLPYGHESHPKVLVRLTPRGVSAMELDRHHGDQIRRLPDGSGELEFRCPPAELDWYARQFASLGDSVDVLEPPELRARLRQLGEHLVARYKW